RRRPVDRARILTGPAHLIDAALGNAKVSEPEHGALERLVALSAASLTGRPHRDNEVGLRQLNLRAVEAKQRLALHDVLSGLVDEKLFDISVRSHGHDGQQRLVVLDLADGPHRGSNGSTFDRLGLDARALDLVEAYRYGPRPLLLVRIDWNVVHPHGVLL